jgi:hypothetical protein
VVRVDGGGDERLVDELVQFLAQSQARRVGALWVGERDVDRPSLIRFSTAGLAEGLGIDETWPRCFHPLTYTVQ